MNYLVLEEQGECCLLVDTRAMGRHPVFFANLLSGCQLTDVFGRRYEPLHVWQSIQEGRWTALLAGNLCQSIPEDLTAAMQHDVVAIKRAAQPSRTWQPP